MRFPPITPPITSRIAAPSVISRTWLLNPAQALGVLALVVSEWHVAVQKCSGYRETLVALGQSRAPPA